MAYFLYWPLTSDNIHLSPGKQHFCSNKALDKHVLSQRNIQIFGQPKLWDSWETHSPQCKTMPCCSFVVCLLVTTVAQQNFYPFILVCMHKCIFILHPPVSFSVISVIRWNHLQCFLKLHPVSLVSIAIESHKYKLSVLLLTLYQTGRGGINHISWKGLAFLSTPTIIP